MQNTYYMSRAKNDYTEYTVKKGDSLYSIAKKFGTTVAEITDVNMLTTSTIFPNQVLLVPNVKDAQDVYLEEYVTKQNDTIDSIARMYNIDTSLIGAYNDFGKLLLAQGQKISIPRKVKTYKVTGNDTLATILQKTGLTLDELVELNAGTWLKKGNTIYI